MNKKEQIACPKCGQFRVVTKDTASAALFGIGCMYLTLVPIIGIVLSLIGLGIFGLVIGFALGIGLLISALVKKTKGKATFTCLNCGYKWEPVLDKANNSKGNKNKQ
ncbi:hypothetical protein H6802_03375 [Candidatus Nomurabacteria bacterium]|nr:hypothetical protein [Candidatus Nomurabacteria bacterium]MCB9827912.1 hypothetical protein [Candidatus Nomurabacteria bacterium]